MHGELKNIFFEEDAIDISSFPILDTTFSCLYSNKNIEHEILSKIIDENTIDDNASANYANGKNTDVTLELKKEISNKILKKF